MPRLLVEFIEGGTRASTLNFTVHNREGLLAHLAANLTDLAIMARPPADEKVSEPFAPHPYVIVAAPSHPLAGKARIECGARPRAFVVREKGSDTWQACGTRSAPHLDGLQVALEITSTETLKQAVIAGLGIGFLSAHTIAQELRTQPRRARRAGLSARAAAGTSCTGATSACRRSRRRSGSSCATKARACSRASWPRGHRAHRRPLNELAPDPGLPRGQFLGTSIGVGSGRSSSPVVETFSSSSPGPPTGT